MSWWLIAATLHELEAQGVLRWAAEEGILLNHPGGNSVSASGSFPTVGQVLAAFRRAGCHGTSWFSVADQPASLALPECPGDEECLAGGGLDLGEVTLTPPQGRTGPEEQPLHLDSPVSSIGFRKPWGEAVLRALCELASVSGPLVAFNDNVVSFVVIPAGTQPEDLRDVWPW